MVKQRTMFFILSGPILITKFVFEVENNLQKHSGKPTKTYPTNYGSIHVAIIGGGFDSKSGRNIGTERNGAT